ncbi:MAG: purine-nucleoside phosphorylase [Chryseolinea sp.]
MDQFKETIAFLDGQFFGRPEIGIVLGTGLNRLLDLVEIQQTIPYGSIPHFPVATVEFHKGNLVFGKLSGKSVVIMQGRFHHYEGYSMQQIVYPIRIMKMLGIETLFLSNAAGGIDLTLEKGDLVLIEDHINLQSGNPLTGKNIDTLGDRFPDMSSPYDKRLKTALRKAALQVEVNLKSGVYAAVNGPNLETRAEYRYLKIIGADVVGMSTVPEVIAANHMKLPCAAISVVTDVCDPDNLQPISIQEIIEVAGKAEEKLSKLMLKTFELL